MFQGVGIHSQEITHSPRKQSPRHAKLNGVEETQIRRARHWNTDTITGAYLTNPPAKVCAHLHRRKIQPTNEEELANAMIEEWDALDQEWINGLIAEQRHWIFEVVACRGWRSAN
jgi:hypothetical protein